MEALSTELRCREDFGLLGSKLGRLESILRAARPQAPDRVVAALHRCIQLPLAPCRRTSIRILGTVGEPINPGELPCQLAFYLRSARACAYIMHRQERQMAGPPATCALLPPRLACCAALMRPRTPTEAWRWYHNVRGYGAAA